jgi:hypothetical protein
MIAGETLMRGIMHLAALSSDAANQCLWCVGDLPSIK